MEGFSNESYSDDDWGLHPCSSGVGDGSCGYGNCIIPAQIRIHIGGDSNARVWIRSLRIQVIDSQTSIQNYRRRFPTHIFYFIPVHCKPVLGYQLLIEFEPVTHRLLP